jgi:NAD(P)-dependent dehydrogenase (short-subunit alcohol dehydrogenase family)
MTTNAEKTGTKLAIVTGGSRGLGRSTVLSLAKRGVHSIFTYHTNRTEAEKVVGAVRELGARAVILQLDTSDVKALEGFVARVRSALAELGAERFDYLVNNAGTSLHVAFDQAVTDPSRVESKVAMLGYCSSKSAVTMLTVQYAKALPEIRINAVDPGYTATDLNAYRGTQTVEQGTDAIVRLAIIGSNGPTGTFQDAAGVIAW